jgi:hypothetical protein
MEKSTRKFLSEKFLRDKTEFWKVCKEPASLLRIFRLENKWKCGQIIETTTILVVNFFMVNDQKGEWLASWLVWGAGSSALSVPGHLSRPILGIKKQKFLL